MTHRARSRMATVYVALSIFVSLVLMGATLDAWVWRMSDRRPFLGYLYELATLAQWCAVIALPMMLLAALSARRTAHAAAAILGLALLMWLGGVACRLSAL